MPIRIDLRRHGHLDEADEQRLGVRGKRQARLVGARDLRGRHFTEFFASPEWYVQQTLACFDEGAGDFTTLVRAPRHGPLHPHRWPPGFRQALSRQETLGRDAILHAFRTHTTLIGTAAYDQRAAFHRWLATVHDRANVLVVGRSPEIEILVYALCGRRIAQLRPCQGVQLACERDGNEPVVTIESLGPDPTPLLPPLPS